MNLNSNSSLGVRSVGGCTRSLHFLLVPLLRVGRIFHGGVVFDLGCYFGGCFVLENVFFDAVNVAQFTGRFPRRQ